VLRVHSTSTPQGTDAEADSMSAPLKVALLLSMTLALPAHADKPLWELGLGVGGLRLPHYRGSDQSHDLVLPVPFAIYRGKIFRATREGARAVLMDGERYDFDISVAATAPTRSKDNLARAGMPDLKPTVEFGPNLNFTLARSADWKLDLRLPARAVVSVQSRPQDLGWTASPVINLDVRRWGWDIGLQGGPLYGSRRYNAYFYDVAPAYATATRPAYAAPAGNGGWRFTTGASRRFGDLWVGAFVRVDSVAGAAFEESPLVRQRSQASFGLAMSWVFATSAERVTVDD
jgi:MipA family protein